VGQRLLLDITFFVVVIVILLNVIFGIIIDTFSSMRVDKLERIKDTNEVCFICGINKQVFDRASDEPEGFKTHIKVDHNMWNYLYFIFMLWEQDKDDDDGLEQYVRRAIDAKEITWFPLRKAMRLQQVESPADLLRSELKESVHMTQEALSGKFNEFQTDVNSMFDQLLFSLKDEANAHSTLDAGFFPTDSKITDDENTVELGSVVSDAPFLRDLSPGKHVAVSIISISGLDLSDADLGTVKVRFVYEGGVTDYRNIGCDQRVVLFDGAKKQPVFDNVLFNDKRKMAVQILYGHSILKFITTFDVSALDLLNSKEDFVLDQEFTPSDQSTPCVLKIGVNNVNAAAFGREVADKGPSTPGAIGRANSQSGQHLH